jgi:Tol biopolymer transport system component/cyclophilin family peptidyl-prolyl cis-trans isomerase
MGASEDLKTMIGVKARLLLLTALMGGLFCNTDAAAQTRVDFHLLPAVSTGPLDPDWSPDSQRLAFAMRGDIWTVPAAGGAASALTSGPAYHSEPAFSPDGSRIALTVDRDGNLDIGIVNAAGGDVELLTDHPELDFAPAWSRDGQSLYFVSRREGNLDILRLDLRDRQLVVVVAGPKNDFQAAISPDGKYLAYVSPVEDHIGSGGIWVKPLPDGDAKLVHFEESSYRMKPHWSPDGASLAYISDAAGSNDVALVPASGGDRVRLTEDLADEFDPALSPDGTRVAFVSNQQGPTRLYTMPATGGVRSSWTPLTVTDRRSRIPTGVIRGRILDHRGDTMPARVILVASDGRSYTQDGSFHRMVPATRTHYQHTRGSFKVEVPAGRASVEAMHGFEFAPVRVEVDVPVGGTVDLDLRLQAFDDPRARGWYSGDMHIHDLHEGRFGLTHEDFFLQLSADDLGVANALIHMDGTKIMGRWSDLTGKPSPLSSDRTILRYSQEFRGSFGHIGLVGVTRFLMPLIGGVATTPFAPDTLALGHIDAALAQGAITGFVHPYNRDTGTPAAAGSRDLPVLAALGKGDFFDVVSVASRELDSAAIYYKLLNSGIRLAATGGTDNFSDVWFDPSGGAARTYARIAQEDDFNFETWLAAVKAGRTFASSGPLLFLTVAGKEPGAEIRLDGDQPTRLDVQVVAGSIAPLDKVEVLVNGNIVHRFTPAGTGPHWAFETSVDLPQGGWVAARAIGPSSRYVGDAFAFAHTSPVYVVRDKRPFSSASDAGFLAKAVEELWRRVVARDSWVTVAQKAAYRNAVHRARDYYRRVILAHPEDAAFNEPAPDTFRVSLDTNKGTIVMELHRDWSPHGVDRLFNLVRHGYYDDSRFYRVRDQDFVQFGIHGDPGIAQAWRNQRIPDDSVSESNLRGTVAFAMGHEPDDRTTQVYINLRDKPQLDAMGFTVMGRVIEGMTVADALFSGYDESAGGGIRGGRQDPIFQGGNDFLDGHFPDLDKIIEARIVP